MSVDLDNLEALDKAATAGPWDEHEDCEKPGNCSVFSTGPCVVHWGAVRKADAALIAAMRNALPELLQAARDLAAVTAERDALDKKNDHALRKLDIVLTERDAARAECERLRKLFDDAGAGEHNVLALIDHYQDEALKATSELVQARQLVALLEDRISDVEDRDDDARTVCEWAATVALKSTDVHNAATRYLTGVQSPLRARLAEVERERDADMRNVERALALADRLRSERDALAAEKALLTRRLKSYSQGTTRGEILDGTPDGTEIAYYRDGVFTRIGTPTSDDESHNCDAMGCGQNHVIQRVKVEESLSFIERDLFRHRVALERINEIRNDIIGRQKVSFSLHVYPLVSALDKAGYVGADYETARAKATSALGIIERLRAVAVKALPMNGKCSHGIAGRTCSDAVEELRVAVSALAPGDLGGDDGAKEGK